MGLVLDYSLRLHKCFKKYEYMKVYSREKYHFVKPFLIARKVIQVDEMIVEEEEENKNKKLQTARVSRYSDLSADR